MRASLSGRPCSGVGLVGLMRGITTEPGQRQSAKQSEAWNNVAERVGDRRPPLGRHRDFLWVGVGPRRTQGTGSKSTDSHPSESTTASTGGCAKGWGRWAAANGGRRLDLGRAVASCVRTSFVIAIAGGLASS